MSSLKQLGRLRYFAASSKYISNSLSKSRLALGIYANCPQHFVGQRHFWGFGEKQSTNNTSSSDHDDNIGGKAYKVVTDCLNLDLAKKIKNGIRGMIEKTKRVAWGPTKGIKIMFDDDFGSINDTDNKDSTPENNHFILELNNQKPLYSNNSGAGHAIWEKLVTAVYDNISTFGELDGATFPLITYEYENKVHVINSVESMNHFIDRFDILSKICQENGDGNQWDDVPTLCLVKLDMQKGCDDIKLGSQHSFEARKFVQTTLGGNGNCIVLLGKTGVGKSSLANALLGFDTEKGPFATSSSADSCTKDLSQFSGFEIGDTNKKQAGTGFITIIDTPGFSDSDGQDDELFEKAYDFFKRLYYGPNLFVLCLDIENPRFDDADRITLKFLYKMFGNDFPKHLIIAFTKCDDNRKDGKRGWGQNYDTLKKEYNDAITKIMDDNPALSLIPISADSDTSLNQIFDIISLKNIGRYSSKQVQSIKHLKEEDAKAEMRKWFQEAIDDLSGQISQLQAELARAHVEAEKARQEAKAARHEAECERQARQFGETAQIFHQQLPSNGGGCTIL